MKNTQKLTSKSVQHLKSDATASVLLQAMPNILRANQYPESLNNIYSYDNLENWEV